MEITNHRVITLIKFCGGWKALYVISYFSVSIPVLSTYMKKRKLVTLCMCMYVYVHVCTCMCVSMCAHMCAFVSVCMCRGSGWVYGVHVCIFMLLQKFE